MGRRDFSLAEVFSSLTFHKGIAVLSPFGVVWISGPPLSPTEGRGESDDGGGVAGFVHSRLVSSESRNSPEPRGLCFHSRWLFRLHLLMPLAATNRGKRNGLLRSWLVVPPFLHRGIRRVGRSPRASRGVLVCTIPSWSSWSFHFSP